MENNDIITNEEEETLPEPQPEDGLSDLDKKNIEASKINPLGGIWNIEKQKWEGYRPTKGITPNWNPYDPEKRKNRITIKERKFLGFLSVYGDMGKAYRAAYTVKNYGDPVVEHARVASMANQLLKRIRVKDPELVRAMTYEDINKDFVKKKLLGLLERAEKDNQMMVETRVLELMGKTQKMFTDKVESETVIREVIKNVYTESDVDFPDKDERLSRLEMDKIGKA